MALFDKSKFSTKKQMHKFLIKNKEQLLVQKKLSIKHADGFPFHGASNIIFSKNKAFKSNELISDPSDDLGVSVVINTTNWFDSHEDVHIPGLWTKSLNENKNPMHVQEHKSSEFSKIIASGGDLKVYTNDTTWKDLGFNIDGTTQALMHDSIVRKNRNPYMHDQYAKGYVTNHSVGMNYVKLVFCCDNPGYGAEFEAFEKYIEYVANKDDVVANSYFWAVTEAKYREGSAVPLGSNPMTPTLENNKTQSTEPGNHSNKNNEPQKNALTKRLIHLL